MEILKFLGYKNNSMICRYKCKICGSIRESSFNSILKNKINLNHTNKRCGVYLKEYDKNIGLIVNDFKIIKLKTIDKNGYKYITKCTKCGMENENYLNNFKKGYSTNHSQCIKLIPKSKYNNRFKKIWSQMRYRTNNPKYREYNLYGGRGINSDYFSDFITFYKDMFESYVRHCEEFGEKETTLDRIDFNGNYCKNNCRWATNKEQANNKRNNIFIEIKNQTKTLTEWCKTYNISYNKVQARLKYNWSIEKALEIE